MSKYGNKRTEFDGLKWDSLRELAYYKELKLRKKAGDFLDFKVKPLQTLQEAFRSDGKAIRAITYTPDFVIYYEGCTEFVDVKGFRTDVFDLKWKMFQYKYRNVPGYKFTLV